MCGATPVRYFALIFSVCLLLWHAAAQLLIPPSYPFGFSPEKLVTERAAAVGYRATQ